MKKKIVAIFPAGTEIGLEIHNALRFVKDIKLIGLASTEDHSDFVYKNIDKTAPYITDDSIIDYLKRMIDKHNIEYIFPAHDEAVMVLTQYENNLGIKVIAPSANTAKICRYKSLTYEKLKGNDFLPKTYNKRDIKKNDFPLFIKPDKGQGSNGISKINDLEELEKIENIESYIICEYLPKEEYTIACISDSNSKLLYAGQRTRSRVKTGISVSSIDIPLENEVENIAKVISNELSMTGAWFFQVKKDINDKYKLLEVAARIAGSMGLHRNQGINFPLLSLYIKDKKDVGIIKNPLSFQLDRAFISRYKQNFNYDNIYIDFDDTIYLNEQVNPFIMHFIYQSKNYNKKIFLITRHNKNIEETLEKISIHKNLFTQIIHITNNQKKSDYIKEKNSIFIDDSFSERMDVNKVCNIPVFDLDSIECLIDWRL